MTGRRPWRGALALLLVSAVALVAGPVTADAVPGAERRVATTVRLQISPSQAIAGESVDLRVEVAPAVRRGVQLQRRGGGRWVTVDRARTSPSGEHAFRLTTPAEDGRFRVRAPRASVGGTTYAADVSPGRSLSVERQSVVLRAPGEGTVGEPMIVYAESFPRRLGRPVALERRDEDSWVLVEVREQNGRGEVRWNPVVGEPGEVVYRATVRAHQGAAAVRSLSVTVTIEPAG